MSNVGSYLVPKPTETTMSLCARILKIMGDDVMSLSVIRKLTGAEDDEITAALARLCYEGFADQLDDERGEDCWRLTTWGRRARAVVA